MSKWDSVRGSFQRAHDDLFDGTYLATFINKSQGEYDPSTGEMANQTAYTIASVNVEIVPPAMDTTVRTEGTTFSWDTSIRFPTDIEDTDGWGYDWGTNWGGESLPEVLTTLGDDSKRPTIVEITDDADTNTDEYELHGYSYEKGSGMLMCRLVEQ